VVVVGPDELAAGEVTLRDMSTKEEKRVALDPAPAAVAAALG
jgi:histidyl-tRNA synthetase